MAKRLERARPAVKAPSISGEPEGVGVDVLCDVLPKDRLIKRVERALKSFQ